MGLLNASSTLIPMDVVQERKLINDCVDELLQSCPYDMKFHVGNEIVKLKNYGSIKDKVRTEMLDLGYAEDFPNASSIKLTALGRTVRNTGGHFKYVEEQNNIKSEQKQQAKDLIFYQSEIAKGYANQAVLLLSIADQLNKIRKQSKGNKDTYASKAFNFLKGMGISITNQEVQDFIDRLQE